MDGAANGSAGSKRGRQQACPRGWELVTRFPSLTLLSMIVITDSQFTSWRLNTHCRPVAQRTVACITCPENDRRGRLRWLWQLQAGETAFQLRTEALSSINSSNCRLTHTVCNMCRPARPQTTGKVIEAR